MGIDNVLHNAILSSRGEAAYSPLYAAGADIT